MLPHYPMYWGNYAKKTQHLTMQEHGAYMMLLAWIYSTGKPVPKARAYNIAKATSKKEQLAVVLVLKEFFILQDDGWHNDKADQVIAKWNDGHAKRVNSGQAGGKQKSSNARASPIANHLANEERCPTNLNLNQIDNPKEGLSLSPNEPDQPEESTDASAKPARKSKRKLPDDWKPHDRHREKCAELSFDCDKLVSDPNGFRNHHNARGNTMLDWDAAFFTWIGNAAKFSQNGRSNSYRNEPAGIVEVGLRVAARHRGNDERALRTDGIPVDDPF